MQQAGIGPDAVIKRRIFNIFEQQCPDGNAEPGLRCLCDVRRSIGGVNIETGRQHVFAILSGAASQFEDARAGSQSCQECLQLRAIRVLPRDV